MHFVEMAAKRVISQVIRENYVELKNLDCAALLDHLYSKSMISRSEKEPIEACVTRHEKSRAARELLDILSTK